MAVSGTDPLSKRRGPDLRRGARRLFKRARRRALYSLICIVIPLTRLLPWEVGCRLGRWLGGAGYLLARRERGLALDHLRQAMGDRLSEEERRDVCRRMFRNVGQGAVEFLMAPSKHGPALVRMVDGAETDRRVRMHLGGGRGLVIVTGHLGNWELLGAWAGYLYFPMNVVGRRIYYEPFNRVMVGMRSRVGMRTIYRSDSPRKLLRCLRRNEIVAILADQDVSDVQGVHVDFFGRPAYTPTGPVSLAMHAGAPMLMASMIREGGRLRIVSRTFEPVETGDRREDLRVNTQRWTEIFEEWITRYPDQWPWYHRRWKTTAAVLERKRRERRAGRRPRR